MESTTWLQDLANNNELWNEIVMEQAPSVIAHEYHRLREMGQQGQVFGFILQLKDVMESILKFQVLLMAAFGQTKQGSEDAYAYHFAKRVLSMGAWHALGSEINTFCEEYNDYPQTLISSWEAIRKAFNEHQWVTWRNTVIAHGALAFDDNQYQEDIKCKLEELKALLDKLVPYYTHMKVVDEHGEYAGCLRARKLEQESGEMYCHIGENTVLSLSNYILHRNHGIYFFDALTSGNLANCLSYPEGERWQESIAYWSHVEQLYKEGQLKGTTNLSTEDITNVLNEAVNRISLAGVQKFVRPAYLIDWLKQLLSENDRGVFLLTMDRGCGKSAFTEKLNRLYANPIELADDLDVRTYHISRTQTMKASQFTFAVSNLWRKAYQNPNEKYKAVEFEEQTLMFIPDENEEPSKAFAEYLNTARKKTYDYRDRKRILFVLDGLDEIVPDAEKIWDYIPAPELLKKGVYILLTGRNTDEQGLPAEYKQRIGQLCIDASLSVSAIMPQNKLFLRAYIKEQLSAGKCKYTDAIANKIIGLSGGRVLYARMYVQLLAPGKYRVEELVEAENIIPAYLEQLKQRYGEKGWKQMVKLLTVLATMYDVDSITLEEISWFLEEGGPTLQLLGMLSDVSCLLNIERGYSASGVTYAGENHYKLVGELAAIALLDYLQEYEDEMFYKLTNHFVDKALNLANKEVVAEEPGYLLMLSCISDYSNRFLIGRIPLTGEQVKQIYSTIKYTFQVTIDMKLYNRIVSVLLQLLECSNNSLIQGELEKAFYCITENFSEDSLIIINQSIEKVEEVFLKKAQSINDIIELEFFLSEMYWSRANIYRGANKIEAAVAESLKSINFSIRATEHLCKEQEKVCIDNDTSDLLFELKCNLPILYRNRGDILRHSNKLKESLMDYDRCIELCKDIKAEKNEEYTSVFLQEICSTKSTLLEEIQRQEEKV